MSGGGYPRSHGVPTHPHPQLPLIPNGSLQNTYSLQASGTHATGMLSCYGMCEMAGSKSFKKIGLISNLILFYVIDFYTQCIHFMLSPLVVSLLFLLFA